MRTLVPLEPLSRALLEHILTPEVRSRVGPVSPIFARPAHATRLAFERDQLLDPRRSVYCARFNSELAIVEANASGDASFATCLRLSVVFPDGGDSTCGTGLSVVLASTLDHFFSRTTVVRIECAVPAHDTSQRKACADAGLRFEAVLRAASIVAGAPLDLALFAATRDEHAHRPDRVSRRRDAPSASSTIGRIALLTGGGDAPGLNAVIRAVVKSAVGHCGWDVLGIEDGFEGLLGAPRARVLTPNDVRGLLPRGGTILGTTNKGQFRRPRPSESGVAYTDSLDEAIANLASLGIDALITIGGDGSQTIAADFHARGVRVVGIPKTIDNDLAGTETTFGFETAVAAATDACDRLHTTAESHDRVMVLEVMGRNAGWIALAAGVAGGADCILIPEIPFSVDRLAEAIASRERAGHLFSIVVAAEGAVPTGGSAVYAATPTPGRSPRLGGVGALVADALAERTGKDVRVVVLGHLQRGGSPTSRDRILATMFGTEAVKALASGSSGCVLAIACSQVVTVPFADIAGRIKTVPLDSPLIETALALGIELGADLESGQLPIASLKPR
jgi:ATP-dependent phosphofructokinase / diphosphate-dependent phosphofructokinase